MHVLTICQVFSDPVTYFRLVSPHTAATAGRRSNVSTPGSASHDARIDGHSEKEGTKQTLKTILVHGKTIG